MSDAELPDDGHAEDASVRPTTRWAVLLRWLLPAALVAVAVRVWALVELGDSFLFRPVLLDHDYYWSWAGDVAGGKLIGEDTFEMDPGYAYWLGLWRALFGDSLWVPRVLNVVHAVVAVLGCGALAYDLIPSSSDEGDDHGDTDEEPARLRRAGHAALVMAIFPVTLFYDLQVMKTSMMVAALPWILWLTWRASRREDLLASIAAGAAFAVGCTIRGNLLPLLPLFVVLASGLMVRQWRTLLPTTAWRRRVAGFTIGLACVLAFPLAHNRIAGGTHTVLTTGGGEGFYIGTFPEGGGEYVKLPFVRPHPKLEHQDFRDEAERRAGRPLDRAESSKFWWRAGVERILADPGGWVVLELRKALLLLSAFEHPDNASFYFWAGIVTPLGLLGPFHFGLLIPLALAALAALAFRRRERRQRVRWSLAVVVGGYLGVFLLFIVYSRFRAPIAPLLIPLAVVGVQTMWRAWRADRRAALAGIGTLLISALVLGRSPPADPQVELGIQYTNYGSWYAAQGERAPAVALFEQAVDMGNVDAMALLGRLWLDEPAREQAGRQLITEAVKRRPADPLPLEGYATLLYRYDRIDAGDQAQRSAPLPVDALERLKAERAAAVLRAAATTQPPPPAPSPMPPQQ
jgi:4-amino-4-deoxy-L-arabinose transferase-like glycosyltransferase